jgi:hypothetical protein
MLCEKKKEIGGKQAAHGWNVPRWVNLLLAMLGALRGVKLLFEYLSKLWRVGLGVILFAVMLFLLVVIGRYLARIIRPVLGARCIPTALVVTNIVLVYVALVLLYLSLLSIIAPFRITSPSDGYVLMSGDKMMVKGRIGDTHAEVWVVVHPVGNELFFIMPRASVSPNGRWQVQATLGGEGHFEIEAFANPKTGLSRGPMMFWPDTESRTIIINVYRKQ